MMIAKFELDSKKIGSIFLESLSIGSKKEVECMVGLADAKILEAALEIIQAKLGNFPNNEVPPHNILYAIMCILKTNRPSTETKMLSNLRDVLNVINQSHPLARNSLMQQGIVSILTSNMKTEAENQMNDGMFDFGAVNKKFITSVHIISVFIPAIIDPDYNDITASSRDIMHKGPITKLSNIVELLKHITEAILPTLYNVCQKPKCNIAYYLLLLKLIYWSGRTKKIANLMPVEEILKFAKILINENPFAKDRIVVGLAIVNAVRRHNFGWLVSEKIGECLDEKRSYIFTWSNETRYGWIKRMYAELVTSWLSVDTVSRVKIYDEYYASQINNINSVLGVIMPIIKNEKESDMNTSYQRLRICTRFILNMPDSSLTVSSVGIQKFNNLVTNIIQTLDAILIRYDFFKIYTDLGDIEEYQHVPKTPMDIQLGLCTSASFDRVLGSSKSPEELRRNPLVRTLRLLSILYEVNENWGVLFCDLSKERLINRSCFISEVLQEILKNVAKTEMNNWMIRRYIYDLTLKYPFLILFKHRQYFFRLSLDFLKPTSILPSYEMARKGTLNFIADNFMNFVQKSKYIWKFSFVGENGYGDGPTKEFYSEFSRDCQRFDRGLWSGSPGEIIDDISYVNSENGLFPMPKHPTDPKTNSCLTAIGMIMAKSIKDDRLLDINFSNAFYKCFFKKNLDAQQLTLIDIKDVMPSIFKYVESLVDALRQKFVIKNDNSLAPEIQNQAISNITCDGCSFEDLCINFTLPGYPDIEMIKGGSETFLNIDNLEDYLKLLIWWLLYKNPQENIKQIRDGFTKILNINMQYFNPHEYEEILCGLTTEQWTVDYLKKNCVLERLTVKTPVVQYLFEVLSSLSASDQKKFLQFVTSSPRLPVGGLAALNPKLTIRLSNSDGDRDTSLPSTATCFNTLMIKEYSSKKILEEKLLLAIREGRGYFHFC